MSSTCLSSSRRITELSSRKKWPQFVETMNLQAILSFLLILSVTNLAIGAKVAPMVTPAHDLCPDRIYDDIRNVVHCGCHVREHLAKQIDGLDDICNNWEYEPLERPCASFSTAGKIDLLAVRTAFQQTRNNYFAGPADDESMPLKSDGNSGTPTLQGSGLSIKNRFPVPYPSPDPKLCRYHCQCCYLCGIPCFHPGCNCNRWTCRKICRPLPYFCPLVAWAR